MMRCPGDDLSEYWCFVIGTSNAERSLVCKSCLFHFSPYKWIIMDYFFGGELELPIDCPWNKNLQASRILTGEVGWTSKK